MEKENYLLIQVDKIESIIENAVKRAISQRPQSEENFESDKITKEQASKLINKSIPTINKLVQRGELKVYGLGTRGKFLLKSEVIQTVKNLNL